MNNLNNKIYDRKIYHQIKPFLKTKDIIVIHGSRQTGKTTLLKLLMKNFDQELVFYMDLEDSRFLEICDSGIENLTDFLKQKGKITQNRKTHLFIDEIQYLKNPSSFLKLAHDHYSNLKLIVSGSSSFGIKKKFKDSLVGRTVNFELFPLDFQEFLIFKEKSLDINKKVTSHILIEELKKLYIEYILYGGYPKIVLTDPIEMKEKYLQQIIDTYIKKDIRDLAGIRDINKFNKILRVLASQCGQLLNIVELSNTTQISRQSVEEYLFMLENTYIVKRLSPFFKNIRSELFKTPKVYFYDTGLYHLLWLKTLPNEIMGISFETSIFSELIKNFKPENIYFWRTQDKKEIDFVLEKGLEIIPIEVKMNASLFNYTAFKYFVSKYNIKDSFCINLEGKLPSGKIIVKNVRPWEYPYQTI